MLPFIPNGTYKCCSKVFCHFVFLLMFLAMITLEVYAVPSRPDAYWNFEDGSARDSSTRRLHGTFVGKPTSVEGFSGRALKFNGGEGIKIPDSRGINTNGTFPNRTIGALFYCHNPNQAKKQLIFEAGGFTKGFNLYVHKGRVYVGAWNTPNLNWNGEYLFADIKSNRWYYAVLVLRNARNKVESDKFEMWMDGRLIGKEKGARLEAHGHDIGIAHVSQHTKYHDGSGKGRDVDWFVGLIDEIVIYNRALSEADLTRLTDPLSVELEGKVTTTWGNLKNANQ